MCEAVPARSRRQAAWYAGHSISRIFCVRSYIGGARHDCFSECNAGADVVQAHMWCVVTLGKARHDYFFAM